MTRLRAALFDLDGLLIDSEPLWRRAEIAQFALVGLHLTEAQCEETTGLRIDEVVRHHHRKHPWDGPSVEVVTERIVAQMITLVGSEGVAQPGVAHALGRAVAMGFRCAVVSSSPTRLIEASLSRIGVRGRFERIVSAEHEPYGKPHPGVYLTAAAQLGVAHHECVVLEDSLNGVLAAKAARMRCIAVPERPDPRFVIADRVIGSLEEIDVATLVG